jgi:ribonuclease P protein component
MNFTRSAMAYPQRAKQKNRDLTRLERAGSNTALFRIGQADEANVPAFQDTARAAPRIPRAQPYAHRARSAARAPRERPQAPRRVGPRRAVLGKAKRARFGLGAERRLGRRVDFERLLRHGARRSASGFALYFSRRPEGPPRLGILISRKHAAKATMRNRIKRCIREAFRLEQPGLGALDVLVRPPYGATPGASMLRRLREIFAGLDR